MTPIRFSLSNVQVELVKLFATSLSTNELNELKLIIAKFYANKSVKLANEVWDGKNLSNYDMDRWLSKK